MAYDASIDYRAKQKDIEKKMETADSVNRTSLQSQWDALEQSRLEKMASNLSKYGKYASDSELDKSAGIAAETQIGTAFDSQRDSVNQYYTQAKQNAENQALSRGMSRSSYAQDVLSRLDGENANALTKLDSDRAAAIAQAKQSILNNYQNKVDTDLKNEKAEYSQNINAYYGNFDKEAERILSDGDDSNDWKAERLIAAKNENQAAHDLALAKKVTGGGSGSGSGGSKLTFPQLTSALSSIDARFGTPEEKQSFIENYGGEFKAQLYALYGLSPVTPQTEMITVPGYGTMDYSRAEALERAGNIVLLGVDANGNPVYAQTNKKTAR